RVTGAKGDALLDPAALAELAAALDRNTVSGLLDSFLADLHRRTAALAAAAAAGDLAAVLREAHDVKSTSATYGAAALHRAAAELERAGRSGEGARCLALAAGLPALVAPTEAALAQWRRGAGT